MARPSKVDRLPGDIREAISKLRETGHTLDEIMAELQQMGLEEGELPSRSGLHRHIQGLDALAERLQRSRTIAEALVRKLGDAPENRTARLNIELMHSVVTDLMLAVGSNAEGDGAQPVTLDAETVHFLSKSLDHLARASKSDAELTVRIKRDFQAELEKKMRQVAGEAAAKPMTPAEALERVRALYRGEA
jgi:hypothetical protein